MDGRGGCCIARYGGGGAAVYDVSKIDQIMLRFRPIAPKPAASGGSKAVTESDNKSLRTGRGRRRRRRNSNPKENSKSKSSSSSGSGDNSKRCRKRKSGVQEGNTEKLSDKSGVQDNAVVTLPLLPETPDLTATMKGQKAPVMLSFDGSKGEDLGYRYPAVRGSEGDGRVGMWKRQKGVVGSWVIVERVTSTWAEEEGVMMGRMSDEEKRRVLEEDTCPGFVTDCWNRVWWTNKAYKKMAREKGGRREAGAETASFEAEVVVWLVMKEKLPEKSEGFTCRVTVQSTWSQLSSTVTVPCDVWRLSDGGFAWRLDVKAALSLGW